MITTLPKEHEKNLNRLEFTTNSNLPVWERIDIEEDEIEAGQEKNSRNIR